MNIDYIINYDIDYNIDDLYDLLIESLIYSVLYNNTNITNTNITNILNNTLYESSPIKHIITDEVKDTLIPIKFKDAINKEKNTSCAITQDELNDEDMIIQLPCNHCFNSDAILYWLTEESCECPVCRYKLESKEKISYLQSNNPITNPIIINSQIQYYYFNY